ncbi:galactose-3-O-sulfotransferase 3 [Austrofundulus limnaeus]|uniref:Galactose-3-O-sulfotransferase 3 n=1 Tax=Austrofundulus limnaeus TaxID=52670 RepID=A0A2I4DD62_AUSLI|nr:PREDICTED: galactose-3-O-sulfotransferase 3-like [Austrofundulus limnaeus]
MRPQPRDEVQMIWIKMSQKKKFLILLLICTVSLLLHNGGHLSWTIDHFRCATLRSPIAPGLKPKHTNIVFLKTHKTASSTLQNILFRFAERNNLTMALPKPNCGHQFCYPQVFSSHFVHPHTLPPNMITSHMRFNKTALQRLMPNDTIYITILREPASMFESLFTYYSRHSGSFRRVPNGSLETFLADPLQYYRPEEADSMYARNTLTFDLGGNKDRPASDVAYAQAFVADVEKTFSLVMISEYFDESLVLLRHLLSWNLDDIVYVKLNMRVESSKKSLSPSLPAKIRSWNSLDAYLYDYFNASLWVKLSALGLDCVAKEVDLIRQAQERLTKSCFGGQMPVPRSASEIRNKDLRPWQPSEKVGIIGYDLPVNISHEAKELCLKSIMPEITYTQKLLHSQLLRHHQILLSRTSQKSNIPQQPMRTTLSRHSQVHRSQPPPSNAQSPGSTTKSKFTPNQGEGISKSGPKQSNTNAL